MFSIPRLLTSFNHRLWSLANRLGPFAPFVVLYLLGLCLLSVTRLGLVLWQSQRVLATGELANVFIQGVRVDLIELGLLSVIPLLLAPLLAHAATFRWWRSLSLAWVFVSLLLLVFMEAATPGFIQEYDIRPNRIFVEYLKYPHEVFGMLWRGFKVEIFTSLLASGLAVLVLWCVLSSWPVKHAPWSARKVWLVWPLLLLLVLFGVRSTLSHRPANPALFAITQDSMVNSLILNSTYSVFYAAYSLQHEAKSSDIYGQLSREKIFALTGAKEGDIPTLTTLKPSVKRAKPLNLVILLQESLGAGFVQSLGGKPVTPNLEQLKAEGIWFTQMYATGTRSVRGIEAVVTGFQPTPADSTVKLDLSQQNFFSLASVLAKQGYLTEFIYGGESHFDNMRSFFMGNGFQQIIDQPDFKDPVFVASWGVSDEDLLNKTHAQLLAHHASGQPFFTLAFSSSNHAPFEFPDGRITLYEQPKATDNNAVKYADYAIGEFIKKAKASPYWQDTVFLIVADHDIRVRGNALVPVEHFHIPALILGGAVTPKTIDAIASQIDLPVTMLSLMGIQAQHPMTGKDLSALSSDYRGRAMMQYNYNFAWMAQTGASANDNQVVVLREGKPPAFAHYDVATKALINQAAPSNAATLTDLALANALLPALLYQEQRYRLPQ